MIDECDNDKHASLVWTHFLDCYSLPRASLKMASQFIMPTKSIYNKKIVLIDKYIIKEHCIEVKR